MNKVSFFNSICYLFVKYAVFFFLLAFINDRFTNAVINNATTSIELIKLTIGYVLYILFYMFFIILLFTGPIYLIFRIRSKVYFILSIISFFCIEYFVYTYLSSPSNKVNGVYNLLIGVVVFVLFFRRQIASILKG